MSFPLPDWPRAHGAPPGRARLRCEPGDFVVEETLGFAPDGVGEHLFVRLRKTRANTAWVAGWLARAAGLQERDIGYAGRKDRHAVTTQWFSLPLGNRPEPAWPAEPGIEILETVRHGRKLRRGALAGNRFRITLRDFQGDSGRLEARAAALRSAGVPNYFGPQRFGRGGANIERAARMFAGERVKRRQRGLYLSAARSLLFNAVLALRVEAANWQRLLPGEAVLLAGSRSYFVVETIDRPLEARLGGGDVHPSGPLWGRGASPARHEALAVETAALAPHAGFRAGLEAAGLEQERRPLRLPVPDLAVAETAPGVIQCHFSLPAGCFATAVLRELFDCEDMTDAGED